MGSIKGNNKPQEHELKQEEFDYVMNVNQAKQNIVQEYNRVLSAFLHYIASNRLGYDPKDNLQFELDFSDEKHILKVTKLPE